MTQRPFRHLCTIATLALLASVALPAVASAGAVQSLWGWVTARQPATAQYQPGSKDQGNSAGGTNTVVRSQIGQYIVTFGGLQANNCVTEGCFGTALATALSQSQRLCVVTDLSSGLPVTVQVSCFDRLGNPADSAFSLNFLAPRGQFGHLAYLYANDETSPYYAPDPNYSFNSFPGSTTANAIRRFVPGLYRVELYGDTHATLQGNVQVSSTEANCKVQSRYAVSGSTPFSGPNVRCRDFAGNDVDATFFMVFANGTGLKGITGNDAYVFANKASTGSYTPAAAFRYASSGQTPTITRSGVGAYSVRLPGQPLGGSAQVTGFGDDKVMCQLSAIQKKTNPQRVDVLCFKPNGTRADSKFYLTLTR